jgi:predicted nucleic acid-binding protein
VSHLLDTNVISEPFRRQPDRAVIEWLRSQPSETLWLSVVTIAEIERGIALAERRHSVHAGRLVAWLEAQLNQFKDRIIPMDPTVARIWGRMAAVAPGLDTDAAIAATAAVHGLTVATRNVRHFDRFGVPVFNPFAPSA